MNAQKPTDGPWSAEFSDTDIYVTGPDHNAPVICDLVPRDADAFTDEDEANANLIAAAPDLLAVLKTLKAHSIILDECTTLVDAVIAKAEGAA